MGRTHQYLSNFTAGEFSPRLYGRVDIAKYFNACKTLQNMIVYPHGGASRRFGTVYVGETYQSAVLSRLIPFQYNVEQAYILEFAHQVMRVYKDNGVVISGTLPVAITSPYTSALLSTIKYVQSADIMRLVQQTVPPKQLTRYSHTSWVISSSSFVSTPAQWTTNDYPGVVALYEQRSIYGATPSYPDRLWFSATGAQDDMSTGVAADDSLDLTLDDSNAIKWVQPGRYLNVGTIEGEWVLSSGSEDAAMTPTARKARRISGYGSSDLQGLFVGNAILFVQRAGRKIRELIYQYASDNYGDPPDLSILSEHITESGIKSWAFAKEPDAILWCVRNDGKLVGFTYNKAQDVLAWHLHETDGYFEDVAVIPTSDHDQVWFIVRRTINGQTKRYIEYMAPDFGDDQNSCWFVDCGLSYSGALATTISGLAHLEGKFVSVLADGAVVGDGVTVTAAHITISPSAASVTVGLPYTSILESLNLEPQTQDGTAQGRRKKVHEVMVRFYKTLGAKIGSALGVLDTIPFRSASDLMDSAPPLFSGDKVVPLPGGWDRNKYVRVEQSQPLPMTVLSIGPVTTTND